MSVGVGIELDLMQVTWSDIEVTPENDQMTFVFSPTAPTYTCLVGSSHQCATSSNFPDDDLVARASTSSLN